MWKVSYSVCTLHACIHSLAGRGVIACPGEGPGREAGDAEVEEDRGQGKAEGAWEAQDSAGAAAGVEE